MKTKFLSFLAITMLLAFGCGEPKYYSSARIIKEGVIVEFQHSRVNCLKQGDTIFITNVNGAEWIFQTLPAFWMKDSVFMVSTGITKDSNCVTVRRAIIR
jgi:hypothetical protein